MAEQVAATIETLLKKQGLWPQAMRWAALSVWAEAVGERVAARAKPVGVSSSCLLVAAESPAWRQELHLLKPTILRRLNSLLGGEYIKDIRFSGRTGRSTADTAEEPGRVIEWPGRHKLKTMPLQDEEWRRIQALLLHAQDDNARAALQRLLMTAAKRDSVLRASGMLPCPVCGALGEGGLCTACRTQEKRMNQGKALSLLSEVPWLDAHGLKEIAPCLGEEEYLTARDILLSVWSKEVKDLRAKRTKSSQSSLRLARAKLAMLLTNTPPESLTEEAVDQAVPDKRSSRAQKT
ncbi:MAG: DUF721 domain-containing protein [Bacillota bacterium]|nr:DUF721 domain-containing protein [Bacillota bacterium]